MFHRGFKHDKNDESTRPQAECFYCFRVFETPMKHEARVFKITSGHPHKMFRFPSPERPIFFGKVKKKKKKKKKKNSESLVKKQVL